jgi:hypothetical protein
MVFFGRICRVRKRASRISGADRIVGRNGETHDNGTEIQHGPEG